MTNSNPRDERGWRIPRPNTKSRQIYNLLIQGKKPCEIARELNFVESTTRVLIFNIKNSKKKNSWANEFNKNKPRKPKKPYATSDKSKKLPDGTILYSKYVKKLVKVLGITHAEAVEQERKLLEKENANKDRLQLSGGGGAPS